MRASGSKLSEAASEMQARSQFSTLFCESSEGRRSISFWRRGSARTATSWLGNSIFSRLDTSPSTVSTSSRVTEVCDDIQLRLFSYRLWRTSCAWDVRTVGIAMLPLPAPRTVIWCFTLNPFEGPSLDCTIDRWWASRISFSLSRHCGSGCYYRQSLCPAAPARHVLALKEAPFPLATSPTTTSG